MPDRIVKTNDPNNLGAFYSFLRVLGVALGVALIPFLQALVTSDGPEDVPWWQILIALVLSGVLTTVNYFRPGDVRFGASRPNAVLRSDHGESTLTLIGAVLVVLGLVLFGASLLGIYGRPGAGAGLVLIGLVVLIFGSRSRV